MTKLLIWDFDGTLGYRREGMWSAALLQILQRELPGLAITRQQISPYLQAGFPWHTPDLAHTDIQTAEQWWEALYPTLERALLELGVIEEQAGRLARQARQVYTEPTAWCAYDDATPVLGRLSAEGWTHVMLSNHVPELPDIVEHLGLARHFAAIYSSAQIGYEKPHPQAFRLATKAFPDASARCMIGDSMTADAQGAEAVGIPAILVHKDDPNARFSCQELSQVPSVLAKISCRFTL